MTKTKAEALKVQMSQQFNSVYDLMCFVFQNSQNISSKLHKLAIICYSGYLKWFPIEIAFNKEVISKFLSDVEQVTSIRVEVMKFFIELFSIPLDQQTLGQAFQDYKSIAIDSFVQFIGIIVKVTGQVNLRTELDNIAIAKKEMYSNFCLQLALSIISFFKTNFSFIQNYDFMQGTGQPNQFLQTYQQTFQIALGYIVQISWFKSDTIQNTCAEFWAWLSFKLCFIKCPEYEEENIQQALSMGSIENFVNYTNQSYVFNAVYSAIVDEARVALISNMTKPAEIKIEVDETGEEIYSEDTTNTISNNINERMRSALIYMTHLKSLNMDKDLISMLDNYCIPTNFNHSMINSICWSIGAISGAMEINEERKFIIQVIKMLLSLCESVRGKTNKAIVASCIMYVVGQYPRFLNSIWRFLKTVVKKLFEFMHEYHPGVRDFACETFLKISIKCGENFIMRHEGEAEPFVHTLCTTLKEETQDLMPHQKLMFYESMGNIINAEQDLKNRSQLVIQLMNTVFIDWTTFFENVKADSSFILYVDNIKAFNHMVRINEKVCCAVGMCYFEFGAYIYENLIHTYAFLVDCLQDVYASKSQDTSIELIRFAKMARKTILTYLSNLVKHVGDVQLITEKILPGLSVLIDKYRGALPENKDPEVLLVLSELAAVVKDSQYDYIVSIWNYLCIDTLNLIKDDFSSFPDHRVNFYVLVKSLISNSLQSLFKAQENGFDQNVVQSICWACSHDQPAISELGLETLNTMLTVLHSLGTEGTPIRDAFYSTFYLKLVQDMLTLLTDSLHKSGFKIQTDNLQILIQTVEANGFLSVGVLSNGQDNKQFLIQHLNNLLTEGFSHLNKVQIEAFVLSLFNSCYDKRAFKTSIRDFLVNLKSFSYNIDELYEEEKQIELKKAEEMKAANASAIPGMAPVYNKDDISKIGATNFMSE